MSLRMKERDLSPMARSLFQIIILTCQKLWLSTIWSNLQLHYWMSFWGHEMNPPLTGLWSLIDTRSKMVSWMHPWEKDRKTKRRREREKELRRRDDIVTMLVYDNTECDDLLSICQKLRCHSSREIRSVLVLDSVSQHYANRPTSIYNGEVIFDCFWSDTRWRSRIERL